MVEQAMARKFSCVLQEMAGQIFGNHNVIKKLLFVKPALTKKLKVMKKIIALAIATVSFAACNNAEGDKTTVDSSSTTGTMATTPSDSSAVTSSTTTSSAYTAADGDVTYTDKKVRVMRGGKWVDADDDVKLDNGVVVYKNGKVKKEDKEIELKDGEVVNRTGNFFDKSGRAIENAWEATKEGAKDAGKAIKKAADKVGDKVSDAVHKDKDDKQ